jgi:hypothetical protein
LRFSFGDEIIPGDFNVNFLTNSIGAYPLLNPTQVPYSTLVVSLTEEDFAIHNYMPVFDIICVDAANLTFQIEAVGKSLSNND